MSEHLSDFALDEVLAGGPRSPHLESCGACRERLARLGAHAESVQAGPHFSRVRARLLAEAAQRPSRPTTSWFSAWLLVPALATLAVVVVQGTPPVDAGGQAGPSTGAEGAAPAGGQGTRVKGPPAVELFRLEDGQVNPALKEGDAVALRLRSGGRPYALVVSMDVGGQVEALWPAGAGRSGELVAEQPAPLFQVTRGDFVVHAIYSDTPLRFDEVRAWLATHGPRCPGASVEVACHEPSGLPPGSAHAAVALGVEARP
ncbi:hypothetical protein [Pyxidicoccus xibeiensis]|uniref:hypothetical protein n=1 Tax=Pyxidicoccus xibeiensis TaxID=2906759 RepID=UPI0020A81FA8|nr:hypothetical protein [Pyxidicoccus xibeiensis]MCP3142792.1 hypothetical protein [Pyxidicoccus xibeiensis]